MSYEEFLAGMTPAHYQTAMKQVVTRSSDIPQELFHYTNTEALQGIIETGSLWATNLYFLNDSSEVSYGKRILAESIDELLEKNRTIAARQFLSGFRDTFLSDHIKPLFSYYATSFCKDGDLLSQWRGYSHQGQGFALGFDLTDLGSDTQLTVSNSAWPFTLLLEIEYEKDRQKALCSEILQSMLDALESRLKDSDYRALGQQFAEAAARFAEDVPDLTDDQAEARRRSIISEVDAMITHHASQLSDATFLLTLLIQVSILRLKHPAFREEGEWRIAVLWLPNIPSEILRFRYHSGSIVPYIPLTLKRQNTLPLTRIVQGPTISKLSGEGVRLYLDAHGYESVILDQSETPLR